MIKIVHRNLSGVSIMADQGRIILQNFSVCNLSIMQIQQNVVASLEGFILYLKLEYFFPTVLVFVLIYDKQVLMCVTII